MARAEPPIEIHSFAGWEHGNAKWYVDGQDYMEAVADAIDHAQREILITDWQLSPKIFLKRPQLQVKDNYWRLDEMLKRRAKMVKDLEVFILLYKDNLVVNLDSDAVVSAFKNEKKIKVHRHRGWFGDLRFSHHEKLVVVDRNIAFVGGIDLCYGRWDTRDHILVDNYPLHPCADPERNTNPGQVVDGENKYCCWVGPDYCNEFRLHKKEVDRTNTPRLPWHDVSCSFTGNAVEHIVRHFIDRYLKSCFFGRQLSYDHSFGIPPPNLPGKSTSNVRILVVRSAAKWSIGKKPRERSIQEAYCKLIREAENFIYIENQFFISSQPQKGVHNKIVFELCERICRAHRCGEDFHVFIVLPLQPEFPGEWGKRSGQKLYDMTDMIYSTLYKKNMHSMMDRLERGDLESKDAGPIPKDKIPNYVSIYGLRTHRILGDKVVTELIYVHSKVMIVDDEKAIIGSANINDRSMRGDWDSEVDVVIEDVKFSRSLRHQLFREHFDFDVENPHTDNFPMKLSRRARENTHTYEAVFPNIIPRDSVRCFSDLGEIPKHERFTAPSDRKEALKAIHGKVVTFPMHFMEDEKKSTCWINQHMMKFPMPPQHINEDVMELPEEDEWELPKMYFSDEEFPTPTTSDSEDPKST